MKNRCFIKFWLNLEVFNVGVLPYFSFFRFFQKKKSAAQTKDFLKKKFTLGNVRFFSKKSENRLVFRMRQKPLTFLVKNE